MQEVFAGYLLRGEPVKMEALATFEPIHKPYLSLLLQTPRTLARRFIYTISRLVYLLCVENFPKVGQVHQDTCLMKPLLRSSAIDVGNLCWNPPPGWPYQGRTIPVSTSKGSAIS